MVNNSDESYEGLGRQNTEGQRERGTMKSSISAVLLNKGNIQTWFQGQDSFQINQSILKLCSEVDKGAYMR